MKSSKAYLGLLARIFRGKGLDTVVVSPGSRNAPLIRTFSAVTGIRCLVMADERSAAYFALGLAIRTGRPVAVACTSGTAALNYAPAVAEAYYQHVPLLVLTADRPPEWIDRGDGQALHQENIYAGFIRKNFSFPQHVAGEEDVRSIISLANEAYDATTTPEGGPVHINFPFSEPLYDFVPDLTTPVRLTYPLPAPAVPATAHMKELAALWNKYPRKMILTGLMPPGNHLAGLLGSLSGDPSVVLLTETTSNLHIADAITCIDKVVSTFTEDEAGTFRPDLLITAGGHIVSKMIRSYLRKHPPAAHWHISPSGRPMDTFLALTEVIPATPEVFFENFLPLRESGTGNYAALWQERRRRSEKRHERFLKTAPFSDLKVFDTLLHSLPGGSAIHLANSTPVRYSQLFRLSQKFSFYSNRGVSGIDGCVSTAAGAALDAPEDHYLLTGDIAFFYDRNGLWHNYVSRHLKIILINNGGGGIFRFIEGPDTTEHLDLFEAPHNLTAAPVAALYGIRYAKATDEKSLKKELQEIITTEGPAILEVFTPREENGEVLRAYFRGLKKDD